MAIRKLDDNNFVNVASIGQIPERCTLVEFGKAYDGGPSGTGSEKILPSEVEDTGLMPSVAEVMRFFRHHGDVYQSNPAHTGEDVPVDVNSGCAYFFYVEPGSNGTRGSIDMIGTTLP